MSYSKDERKRLERYHPECLRGEHVPVAATDRHNRIIEVYCQNCMIPMTKEQHRAYFGNKYTNTINYNEPGDPNDVGEFVST